MTSPHTSLLSEDPIAARFSRFMAEGDDEPIVIEEEDPPTEKQWEYFERLLEELKPATLSFSLEEKKDFLSKWLWENHQIDIHLCSRSKISTVIDILKEEKAKQNGRPKTLQQEFYEHRDFVLKAIREIKESVNSGNS